MITHAQVRNEIDDAERAFQRCYRILRETPRSRASQNPPDILGLQPTLARTIFGLDQLHSRLSAERKSLVSRKASLNDRWLRARLRRIRNYQDSLAAAASIGRSIGDALAWVFYRDDPDSLAVHLGHAPVRRIPNSVGGRGEVAFINTTQGIDGYFIVYHGITTLLRHGDISVFNLSTRRLAAIGELKAKQIGPKEFSLTVSLIGSSDIRLFELISSRAASVSLDPPASRSDPLPAALRAKLDRQMRGAAPVVTPPKSDKEISHSASSALDGLRRLLTEKPQARVHALKVSDSQVLVRIRQNATRLSSRLIAAPKPRPTHMPPSAMEEFLTILLPEKEENELSIASVLNPGPGYVSIPGVIPFLWWPLPSTSASDLLFHRALVFSVLNMGSIVRKLRSIGLDVERQGRRILARKVLQSSTIEVQRLEYFLSLIIHQCYPEDDVIELISKVLDEIESQGITEPTQIDLRFHQIFGVLPA